MSETFQFIVRAIVALGIIGFNVFLIKEVPMFKENGFALFIMALLSLTSICALMGVD